MATERFSLKDHLFNAEKVSFLGGLLATGVPDFDRSRFETEVMRELSDLGLKERIALIARVLAGHLDWNFDVAATQIRASLPPPLDPTLTDDDFGDFIIAPFGKYIEDNGLHHYGTSIRLLHDVTMRFSMEGSIRPFIDAEPERTLEIFHGWVRDENYHVRRLVSESTRPLLPWAPRIGIDVAAAIPLLDSLHTDPTRYVTRSVANHVNDISKIDSSLALATVERWIAAKDQERKELAWMARHSLRTLIKRGDPDAMEMLGYSRDPEVVAVVNNTTPKVRPGTALTFAVTLSAAGQVDLLVDYAIEFVKKNGERRPKIFRLGDFKIGAGESKTITKRHPLRTDATTYTLYPGTHLVRILANGKQLADFSFELQM